MKKFIILALLLMLIGIAAADVYTIGTGTSTQSYIPFYGLYDYSWSKVAYTAAELSTAGLSAGQIDGIGFEVGNTPSNYVSVDQRVFIRHTTATELDATYPDNTQFQNVYQANYTWNGGGWHHIMFSSPFIWDGTSNIEILWENWDGAWASGPNFTYTSTSPSYLAAYKYQDDSFPTVGGSTTTSRPNIQIVTPQLDPPDPAVLIAPANAGLAFTNTTLSWTSGGGMPSAYNVYFGNSNPPAFVANQTATSYVVSDLDPATTYYWQIVPENANGSAQDCPVWSFSTPSATQIAEGFESTTFPPAGWANPGTWSRSTTTPVYQGSATAYKYGSSSTAYLLSLPMLTINSGDYLRFASRASTLTGTLDVVYSEDRSSWTLLQTITHGVASAWQSNAVDLSSIAGNYYLGIRTGLQSASFYIDNVFGPEITPLVPGAPTLSAPADLAVNNSEYATFTWNAPSTGGVPTGYNIYLDTVDGRTQFATNVTSPYVLDTALAYNTTYYWTVEAYNATGTGEPAPVRSFTTRQDPIIYVSSESPWLVDFGTLSGDWPVLNWTQLTGVYGVETPSSGTHWYRDEWLNGETGNNAAKINIYGTARYGWLVTPPISIPATGFELKFDLGLTDYASTNAIEFPDGQADDKFIVLIADNPMMTGATPLRTWDNDASAFVYNEIPNTGTTVILDLDGYVGTYYVAFYGESTVSVTGEDNDLFVDNVTVRETPLAPIISVTPDSWDFGTMPINTTTPKEFTVSNVGAGTLTVNSINVTGTGFALADAFTTVSLLANESSTFTVNFAPTTEGTYSGNIAINDNRAATNISLSGTGYPSASLPLTENWESGQGDWMIANGTQTNAWYIGTADPYAGANSAYISNDGGVTNAYTNGSASVTHLYRDIAFDANMLEFPLSFMWKCEGEGTAWDRMRVHLVDPSVTPVAGNELTIGQVGLTNYNVQADWVLANITLPGTLSGSVKRLVFSWKNDGSGGTMPPINIDDISLTAVDLPAEPEFVYSPNAINFGTVTNAALTGPQIVTISNNGGGELAINASDISISGANATEFSFAADNLPASLGFGESVEIPVFVTGVTEGAISATLTINYDSVDYDVALSANVLPAGTMIIGNGSSDNDLPINTFYGYTYSQSIYLQSEINSPDQRIEKISYYWNGYSANNNSNSWNIYMGHTSASEFASTSDWIPLSALSQVFSGTVDAPASEGWVEIILDSPFIYNNTDNLVIAVDENAPSYGSSSQFFYTSSAQGYRSLRYQSDSSNPDPANPPTGTRVLAYPNLMLQFGDIPVGAPGVPVLMSPANAATDIALDEVLLSWNPSPEGGTPTEYFVLMGTTNDPDTMEYFWEPGDVTTFNPTLAENNPITFNYSETWYWTVMATNGDGESEVPTPFSFTIMPDPRVLSLPYSQNFDGVTAPNLPAQWVGMLNPTSTLWYVDTYSSTTYAVSQPNTARMYNYSSTTADIRLITPEILVPMNSIKLSFSARGSSGYTLLVGTTNATDATGTFNQLASFDLSSTHTIYTVSLADYVGSDQYICFKHGLGSTYRSIYIDDVNMEMLTPYDLAVTDFAGDSYGLAGDQLSYTVTVTNNGTAAQNSYSVQLLSQTRDVLATLNVSESLEPGASAQHIINWTPSIADTYDVYAKVILAGDANPTNDESYLITVAIFSVTSFTPLVGNIASATSTTSIPFHMYWKNNVAETIYMAHEMQMVSGTINAIVYHNNFTQNINVPVKVWMKHTTESINAAWLPFDDYTLVYDGNIFFPAGVNPIVIPLQTPFQYTGGNLAIRTNRVMDTRDYGNSEKYFYTTDNMNPNRTRYYQADSSVIDPANPGLTNAGTQSSMIPNTGFIVDPYVALPAPSAPVVQIAMSGTNPQLSWNAVDNAYVYAIYGSDDPYDWSAESEIATTSGLTYNIASPTAKKFYKVVARTYGHQDRSLGIVLNPASVIGFDNSSVKRMLPTINTENKD